MFDVGRCGVRVDQQRAESPVPSCVSMKSDQSKGRYMDFKDGHHSTDHRSECKTVSTWFTHGLCCVFTNTQLLFLAI